MLIHRTEIRVEWGDCDPLGIVFFGNRTRDRCRLTHATHRSPRAGEPATEDRDENRDSGRLQQQDVTQRAQDD